MKIYYRK